MEETFTKWAIAKIDKLTAEVASLKAELAKQNQALYLITKEAKVKIDSYYKQPYIYLPSIYDNDNKHDNDFELIVDALGVFDLVFEAREELSKEKAEFDKAVMEDESENV